MVLEMAVEKVVEMVAVAAGMRRLRAGWGGVPTGKGRGVQHVLTEYHVITYISLCVTGTFTSFFFVSAERPVSSGL